MTIVRANQVMQQRLIRSMTHMIREVKGLKSRQLDGGENYVVTTSGLIEQVLTRSVALIETFNVSIDVAPLDLAAVTSELGLALYINNDNDPDYLWPDGPALTAGQVQATWLDWRRDVATSDDVNGVINYLVSVRHLAQSDVGITQYFLKARVYYPQKAVA